MGEGWGEGYHFFSSYSASPVRIVRDTQELKGTKREVKQA
jgi:hypothetical protein